MSNTKSTQKPKRINFYLPQGLLDALDKEVEELRKELGISTISRNNVVVKALSDAMGYKEE